MKAALAALFLLPGAAAAQDCGDPQTQVEMNACAEQGWKDADQMLNALWGQVKARAQAMDPGLPPAERAIWRDMLESQRAWIAFRDKSCAAEASPMRGGSAGPLLVSACRARLTRERVEGLRIFLDQSGS